MEIEKNKFYHEFSYDRSDIFSTLAMASVSVIIFLAFALPGILYEVYLLFLLGGILFFASMVLTCFLVRGLKTHIFELNASTDLFTITHNPSCIARFTCSYYEQHTFCLSDVKYFKVIPKPNCYSCFEVGLTNKITYDSGFSTEDFEVFCAMGDFIVSFKTSVGNSNFIRLPGEQIWTNKDPEIGWSEDIPRQYSPSHSTPSSTSSSSSSPSSVYPTSSSSTPSPALTSPTYSLSSSNAQSKNKGDVVRENGVVIHSVYEPAVPVPRISFFESP